MLLGGPDFRASGLGSTALGVLWVEFLVLGFMSGY